MSTKNFKVQVLEINQSWSILFNANCVNCKHFSIYGRS